MTEGYSDFCKKSLKSGDFSKSYFIFVLRYESDYESDATYDRFS